MCGIFGFATIKEYNSFSPSLGRVMDTLLLQSQTRGKDASGVVLAEKDKLSILKSPIKASKLIKLKEYLSVRDKILKNYKADFIALAGHSRMVTNGNQNNHSNNQPVTKDGTVIIHNGIIVNVDDLWAQNPDVSRSYEVDTEIIGALIRKKLKKNLTLQESIRETYKEIKGVASIAVFLEDFDILFLGTNNGSLYYCLNQNKNTLVFASEAHMLHVLCNKEPDYYTNNILHLHAGKGIIVSLKDLKLHLFDLNEIEVQVDISTSDKIKSIEDISTYKPEFKISHISQQELVKMSGLLENNLNKISQLNRCTRCLLPETFPSITYDEKGVCSICNNYKPIEFKGKEALEAIISKYRGKNNRADVIVPLSGGRDSIFSLYSLKKEFGMNPVAYTYDWGMVTDLARRNISRITAQLGVEHILISADIKQKRKFIQQNVAAWLKRPELGVIPLFMAGDKQFFYYANMLQKQQNIDLLMFGMNPLERTDFKVAFTGVYEKNKEARHYHLSMANKIKMAMYYGKQYIVNPSYINMSIADTIFAYISYYFIPHSYHIFYDYIPWEEKTVNDTILNKCDFELSPDTKSTWRIGDGTASFYNYIYYTVAGFTENDTFRSNQIRQGLVTREEAIGKIDEENTPRFESIKWYLDTIGLDFESTVKTINRIPKLYH